MSGGTNRGFVFRNGTTNVAGIDSTGRIYSSDGRIYLNNATDNFIIASAGTSSALYMEARGGGFRVRDASSGSSWFTAVNGVCTAGADFRAPIFYDSNDTAYYVDLAANNRMRNLNLGGTSAFDATLHIVGIQGGNGRLTQMSPSSSSQNGLNIMSARNASNADLWWAWGPNTSNVWCINSGTTLGTGGIQIDTSGNITAAANITAYSDINLKKNIELIDNALNKVQCIRGVTFERIDSGARGTGVIAQEIEKVLPEVVMEDENGIKSVAYGNVVGLLIEAIKELKAEIDELKAR